LIHDELKTGLPKGRASAVEIGAVVHNRAASRFGLGILLESGTGRIPGLQETFM
jgi:hypothetical protein